MWHFFGKAVFLRQRYRLYVSSRNWNSDYPRWSKRLWVYNVFCYDCACVLCELRTEQMSLNTDVSVFDVYFGRWPSSRFATPQDFGNSSCLLYPVLVVSSKQYLNFSIFWVITRREVVFKPTFRDHLSGLIFKGQQHIVPWRWDW
jgi:hypothetical protein